MVSVTVEIFPENVVLWLVDHHPLGGLDQDQLEIRGRLDVHDIAADFDVLNHLVIGKIPYDHVHG